MSNLAKSLRVAAAMNDLNYAQAAKVCGVTNAMLSRIKRGTANPHYSTIEKIATGLNFKTSEFIRLGETATAKVADK